MKNKEIRLSRGGWWPCEENVLNSMLEDGYKVCFIAKVMQRDRMGVHAKILLTQRQNNRRLERLVA